jgi:hypothetical protein
MWHVGEAGEFMLSFGGGRGLLKERDQLEDIGLEERIILTHRGRVTQICVFTLQLCRMGDANLRF